MKASDIVNTVVSDDTVILILLTISLVVLFNNNTVSIDGIRLGQTSVN